MEQKGTSSKLSIEFPDKLWLGQLSREFPYYKFEIKSFIPIKLEPFVGNSLITISGNQPNMLLEKIKNHPSLKSFFVMEQSATQITLNTQTHDQFLLQSIVKNSILVKFPITISQGKAEFLVTGSRENIDKFIEELTAKGIKVELKQIGDYVENDTKEGLTNRQYFIYLKAKEKGYYDSPRKISLSELAKELEMSKSSLSAILQRIHKKLLGS